MKPKNTYQKQIITLLNQNQNQIQKFMGYGTRKIPPIIEQKLEEELKTIDKLINPSYYYQILDEAQSSIFWDYEIFKSQKPKTQKIALIAYTIGGEIEEKIKNHSQDSQMIKSLILDKIGVVALDSLKDIIIEEIKGKTRLNKIYEIYPSNGDFPIEGQELIYKILCNKEEKLENISINKYHQLSPLKSVTVAVILGEKEEQFHRCQACKACKMEEP